MNTYLVTCAEGGNSATTRREAFAEAKDRRNTTLGDFVMVWRGGDECIARWNRPAEGRGNKWVRVNP